MANDCQRTPFQSGEKPIMSIENALPFLLEGKNVQKTYSLCEISLGDSQAVKRRGKYKSLSILKATRNHYLGRFCTDLFQDNRLGSSTAAP